MSGPIVAMGGAEFAMRAENEALHDYVLGLAAAREPKICLLPTASGDPQEQISSFHGAMDRRDCTATSISLFRLGEVSIDLARTLLDQDVIYVTGGNMVNLMALWREHGLDEILPAAHGRGTVLCGYSAGSMCWFDWGVSRGVGKPVATRGLGLIEGSHCVHYSQDPSRRSAYRELLGSGAVPAGLALDDYAAALFRGGAMVEAVRSRGELAGFPGRAGAGRRHRDSAADAAVERRCGGAEPALAEMRAIRRMRGGAAGSGR